MCGLSVTVSELTGQNDKKEWYYYWQYASGPEYIA